MALTEEAKKRIKEEELYKAKVRGEITGQKKVNWKTYFISSLIIWAIAILLVVWYYLLPMASQQQATGVYQMNSKVYMSGRDKNGNLVKESIELIDRPCNVNGEPIITTMIKNGAQVKITDRQIWYYVTIVDEKGEGKSGWVSDAFVRPHDI